jgi:hypothetical protein
MLCGIPPFYDDNVDKIFENIKTNEIKYPKRVKLSVESQDLINKVIIFLYFLIMKNSF